MKRILLQGYYGVHNLGDDYILYSILNTLEGVKKCEVLIYSQGDEYTNLLQKFSDNKYKICKSKQIRFLEKLKDIKKSTHWIIGGGGLFPRENLINSLCYLVKVLYAKIYKVKIAIYGVEFNSFHKLFNIWIWKIIFKNVDLISVRNKNNAEMLKNIKIKNVHESSDVTFSLATQLELNGFDSRFIKERIDGPYIIWALGMPWRKEELANPNVKNRYNKLCKMLINNINRFPHLEHVILPFFRDMDEDFANDICSRLEVKYTVFHDNDIYDIDEKRYIFQNAVMAVCMRFHSVIFSLYNAIPFCAISYSPKTSNVLEEVGMEDRMVTFGIRKEDFFYKEFDVDDRAFNTLLDRTLQQADNKEYINRNIETARLLKQKANLEKSELIFWLEN